jgi:hypothetical protein
VANSEREKVLQERVVQRQASGLSQRAYAIKQGFPVRQVGYWGAAAGRCASTASAAFGAGRPGCRSQPAKRAWLDIDITLRCARQLAGRIAARPVMQLSADAIWLATAAVDVRTGIDGLSLHVQQALGRPPCYGTAYVFANRVSRNPIIPTCGN